MKLLSLVYLKDVITVRKYKVIGNRRPISLIIKEGVVLDSIKEILSCVLFDITRQKRFLKDGLEDKFIEEGIFPKESEFELDFSNPPCEDPW